MASRPAPKAPLLLLPPVLVAIVAALASAALVLWLMQSAALAAGFGAGVLALGAVGYAVARAMAGREAAAAVAAEPDWSVARVIADAVPDAVAVTDRAGRMIAANSRYAALFPDYPVPPNLPLDEAGLTALTLAARTAWRDGMGRADGLVGRDGIPLTAELTCTGEQMLVWRLIGVTAVDRVTQAVRAISGALGDRIGGAGVMVALLSADGHIRAANPIFRLRATGQAAGEIEGKDFATYFTTDERALLRFEREGTAGNPLRAIHLPFADGADSPILIALIDEEEAEPVAVDAEGMTARLRALVTQLPIGVALIDREGRFVELNSAFARSTGTDPANPPLYPGDLVVREDKAAMADAVRRFAAGAREGASMAVRMASRPDEAVAVSFAALRGMGDAAVLMSLKDSGEETTLKRQVAQATKMQAVGQLAGGVAHDFNNILTAIIGHCDLMLMRHTPGDSDYDDIQQVRLNANRAAALTRQLLAFSRQQTLRPQVLQLPDIISEVTNLLKRLMGETVELVVQHGRDLGPVRADPGQLEQVVVNLAVNARDAMLAANPHGGGKLTIETFAVGPDVVRAMEGDLMPVGDYTALRVTDTGPGIPLEVLPKIFEPFFTTKEVGKGTGLGLSTVYGIIKQSEGYIFADSAPGRGACFTIYLPVHRAAPAPGKAIRAAAPEKAKALWGSGTILLVEDEDMVRAVAERALERQGYKVLSAENGEAALALLDKCDRPDLLISDVVMPIMDGPTMVRRVRQRYPDLPILFMSGYAEEQLRRSIDLDQVSFIPKPFSVQQLAEAVQSVMTAQ